MYKKVISGLSAIFLFFGGILSDPVQLAIQKKVEDLLSSCKIILDVEEGPSIAGSPDTQLWNIRASLIGEFSGDQVIMTVLPDSSSLISDLEIFGLPASLKESPQSLGLHPLHDNSCRQEGSEPVCELDVDQLRLIESGRQPASVLHGSAATIMISPITSSFPTTVVATIRTDDNRCSGADGACVGAFISFSDEDFKNGHQCSVYKRAWHWDLIGSALGITFLMVIVFLLAIITFRKDSKS